MVDEQLRQRQITNERVLAAMYAVPRHAFVDDHLKHLAYNDSPLPIGEGQTISQPYIVALMTALLDPAPDARVLEIGTGCGYQTAVLCELAAEVHSIEYHPSLAVHAARTLERIGCTGFDIHIGDGSQGLPDQAPFDGIVVTAAAPYIPGPLAAQLKRDGGRLVVPVANGKNQNLLVVTRSGDDFRTRRVIPVRFVPLVGRYGYQ